jgi:hypothetical protein
MAITPFGWEEVAGKVQRFSHRIPDDVEKVLDSAANVYAREVAKNAPRSGQTRGKTAYFRTIKILTGGRGYRIVGSDKVVSSLSNGKFYNLAFILEFGSSKHIIEGNPLFWSDKKGAHFAMRVNHPGTEPQPHFAPSVVVLKQKFPNIYLEITKGSWK